MKKGRATLGTGDETGAGRARAPGWGLGSGAGPGRRAGAPGSGAGLGRRAQASVFSMRQRRSRDIGSSNGRIPIASRIALASAGATGL